MARVSENYPSEPPAPHPGGHQPYGPPAYEPPPPYPQTPAVYQPQPVPTMHGYAPPVVRPTSTKAVAALILGLVWGCGFLSVIGLVLNLTSWKETSSGERGGHGIQVVGLVLNVLGTIVLLGGLAFWIFLLVTSASRETPGVS